MNIYISSTPPGAWHRITADFYHAALISKGSQRLGTALVFLAQAFLRHKLLDDIFSEKQ